MTMRAFLFWAVILIAMVEIATLILIVTVGLGTFNRLDHQGSVLQTQALHTCEIANVARALDNASHRADYQFVKLQIKQAVATQKEDYAALLNIGVPKPVLDRALKNENDTLAEERKQAKAKTWATLTNCTAGVNQAIEVFTIAEHAPPASQTDPANAALAHPKGSIP
jgi:hypothetical protein